MPFVGLLRGQDRLLSARSAQSNLQLLLLLLPAGVLRLRPFFEGGALCFDGACPQDRLTNDPAVRLQTAGGPFRLIGGTVMRVVSGTVWSAQYERRCICDFAFGRHVSGLHVGGA
jgi:hypothetical protein